MQSVLTLLFAVAVVLIGILRFKLHAFLALLLAAFMLALLTPVSQLQEYASEQLTKGQWTARKSVEFVTSSPATRVAEGFGGTATSIGILIGMAAIVGNCLLESGAADRIVRTAMKILGQGQEAIAFLGSGFLLAIPVFFDTVFYLLMPLGKALWLRTRRNYLLYVLSIVAGATMAHSLVPPTPGPLLVAGELGVDLPTMALGGILVGSFAAFAGFGYGVWIDRRMPIPMRPGAESSIALIESQTKRPETALPPIWLAITPIVLPFLLITLDTGLASYQACFESGTIPGWVSQVMPITKILGNKNVALAIAAAISMLMVYFWSVDRDSLTVTVRQGLQSAGVIILITSAGGAFGAVVRQGGVAEVIADFGRGQSTFVILPLAFAVAAFIRTAQGSATVAMVTSVGVLSPLAESGLLSFHPVYLALAIGCGSKPVSWMADSGFWVICQMSGLSESEGLRTVSPITLIMGVTGLIVTMIGALLFPLQ